MKGVEDGPVLYIVPDAADVTCPGHGDLALVDRSGYGLLRWDGARDRWDEMPIPESIRDTDYWQLGHRWVRNFSSEAGLHSAFVFADVSIWWIRYGRILFFNTLERGQLFMWIDTLQAVIANEDPHRVIVHAHYRHRLSIVEQVAPHVEIITLAKDEVRQRSIDWQDIVTILSRLLNIVFSLLVLFRWLFGRRADTLVLSSSHYLRREGIEKSGNRLRDVYVGQVIESLRQQGRTVRLIEKDVHGDRPGFSLRHRGLTFLSTRFLLALTYLPERTPREVDWDDLTGRLQVAYYGNVDISSVLVPLAGTIRRELPRFLALISWSRRLLSRLQPESLLVVCAYYFEFHALIIAARQLGIPSYEVQHGIIHRHHLAYLRPDNKWDLGQADVLLAWGNQTRMLLMENGRRREELSVVGNVRLSPYLSDGTHRQELIARVREYLKLRDDQRMIMHTASPETDVYATKEEIVGALRSSLTRDTFLVVKVHPSTRSLQPWRDAFAVCGVADQAVVLREEVDLYGLLLAACVHISFNSSTVIEAAALSCPNVILQFPGAKDPTGYLAKGAGLGTTLDGLSGIVSRLLYNSEARTEALSAQSAFARDWIYCNGEVVPRIVSHLSGSQGSIVRTSEIQVE